MFSFDNVVKKMSHPVAIIIIFILMIFLFNVVDKPLAEYFSEMDLRKNVPFLNWFTDLGLSYFYLAFFFLSALFFRYVKKNKLWENRFCFLWVYVLFADIICVIFKVGLGRARPSLWLEDHLWGFYGLKNSAQFWSFPSGHTTTIMATAFGLSIIFSRYTIFFVTIGLLVALSRVVLVHHYLTDVLSATYLALLTLSFLLWFLQKKSWLPLVSRPH